ncbi:MAG: serine/threonine protein kinase [Verrucomicrobiales bacterium]|jgi:serine/threonine protein kinase
MPSSRRRLAGLDARGLMAQGVQTEADESAEPPSFPSIPGYTVLDFVGRGGMGAVFRARQESLDRDVAIKLLVNTQIDGGMLFERLGREARSMAKLRHANIVAVYDFITLNEGQAAIVMESIEGDSLRPILRQHRNGLPLELAIKLGSQIAEALSVAHENGIVHRDVKPENILIDQDDSAKVSDFGLALPLGDQSTRFTVSGTTMGTLGYMAPEQLDGREVDARADVYSLGVILYEMLTGVRPHGNVDPPRKLRPEIPKPVSDAVMRALRQSPNDRFESARQLLAALRARTSTPRRNWLAIIVGIAALIGLFFGGPKVLERLAKTEPSEWQNLLTQASPNRDRVRGNWWLDGSDFVSGGDISILRMPVNPGASYDVRFSFSRVNGNLSVALFFRTERGMGSLEFDSWNRPGLSGVQRIGGVRLTEGNSFTTTTLNHERHEFILEVRPETLGVRDADGTVLRDYDIRGAELQITDPWGWENDASVDFIAIGSYNSETRFHEVSWRPAN